MFAYWIGSPGWFSSITAFKLSPDKTLVAILRTSPRVVGSSRSLLATWDSASSSICVSTGSP